MTIFLQTERLLFRRFTQQDLEPLVQLNSDPEVIRYTHAGFEKLSPAALREKIRTEILPGYLRDYERGDSLGVWATIEKSSSDFLGWFHFQPTGEAPGHIELGYRLCQASWGKGYATEGARALIRKGFEELGVERVFASALLDNAASINVMEKLGMKLEEQYRHATGSPAVRYAICREQLESR